MKLAGCACQACFNRACWVLFDCFMAATAYMFIMGFVILTFDAGPTTNYLKGLGTQKGSRNSEEVITLAIVTSLEWQLC
jgi:hypothetical protein